MFHFPTLYRLTHSWKDILVAREWQLSRALYSVHLAHLAADHAVGEAHDVGVRPGALGPRLHVLQVVREVHRLQLVVHKLADVPRQVVVAAKERDEGE